ncbi:hypothetical protein [Xanthobacter agilis]|jgi:hypothetical protein|uniref:Uncharacterized protein n=1 Tax=Xanthobacter agilis TaxID=47492 RepID=A0ABU0LDS7_XANAG|nr:hypothetical protein [Xanthobacter agilis]MDQ0505262.1 hypothetical protein [Xanthobacter agilis]
MDSQKILIHARFNPSGTVVEISERPASLDAQEWFNYLAEHAGTTYQALAGGRGVYRLNAAQLAEFKSPFDSKAA